MKIRNGFVSNSSSSSFIIKKENLTPRQIVEILEYRQFCKAYCDKGNVPSELDFMYCYDEDYHSWSVNENDDTIEFYTSMDNFDMHSYLTKFVHVDEQYIEY